MKDRSLMVKPGAHNAHDAGSNPAGPTKNAGRDGDRPRSRSSVTLISQKSAVAACVSAHESEEPTEALIDLMRQHCEIEQD